MSTSDSLADCFPSATCDTPTSRCHVIIARAELGERRHLSSLVDQAEDVWAVLGTVRNRIAHGSDKQPRSAQLGALTRLAHTVAIGAALNLLGVPDTVLCAAIDQGRWPVI